VFGSRATGRARRYSDLDLAIDAGRPLTLDEIAGLAEAFSDSDLPYKIDLADWHNIDDRWRQSITAERVALTEAAHPDGPGLSQSGGCAPGGALKAGDSTATRK
jgi:predicted nucleotidyltransferase